jgi:putative ABC transport system permease protein
MTSSPLVVPKTWFGSILASIKSFFHDLYMGWFIAYRTVVRGSKGTTILVIFIMALTFLNMVVVSGILVGLIDGGNIANKEQYTGDVIITRLSGEQTIQNSQRIIDVLENSPFVEHYSARYGTGVTISAGFTNRTDFSKRIDSIGTTLLGIDVVKENQLTGLSDFVTEGSFIDPTETGYILLGADTLRRYNSGFGDGFDSLDDVYPGDKVKVTAGTKTKEFIVKGIVDTKVGEVSFRAFVPYRDLIGLTDVSAMNAIEIAVTAQEGYTGESIQSMLVKGGFDRGAKIQTADQAIPEFLNQIKLAFGILGSMIGFIGLIVAATTIFIIIFINAVTRMKYIGILKGIGVRGRVIRNAYVIQALFYALVGSAIASAITYGLLVPAFLAHPVDFPFSDGILSAPINKTVTKFIILMVVTYIAGLLPAWLIVRKNTLSSILGR